MVKVKPVQNGRTSRMSFSRINEVIGMPNLIEIQKNSYNWFLDEGLREVFHDIDAIEDYTGNLSLEFVDYRLDKHPKYTIKECKERDATYACTIAVPGSFLSVHKKFVFCCILCLCLRTLFRSFRRCALRLFLIFSFCLRRILRLTGIYSLAFLCGRIRQGIFTGKSRKIPHACQIAGKILLAKLGSQGRTFDPQMDIISFFYQLKGFYQC